MRFGTESKTEDDTNDSELQHGGPHMVEVLNSSQPGSERKGGRPQKDSPTFWIWPGNGILDAPTPGFRTEGRHLTNAENRNRSVSVSVGKSDRLAV